MRVWDIHPGYLNRQNLLGEHQEVHAILSIVCHQKRGYRNHPETVRWSQNLGALRLRHDLLVSEMELRGYRHRSPVDWYQDDAWPEGYLDTPAAQFALLRTKYADREPGRIPLPHNSQELWAHHKYSVLARDPDLYRRIGTRLGSWDSRGMFEELSSDLTWLLRTPPPSRGRLRNALHHMWGHVSHLPGPRPVGLGNAAAVLSTIRQLSVRYRVRYLLSSTALSDLDVWMHIPSPGLSCPDSNDLP
jgi:hypothetical protein